jgi:regulator of replication initiation timing
MKEKLVEFRERISALSPELERIPEAKQLIEDMLQEMNELHRQNHALRNRILKSSSKESRMSSKLRDALYE